MANDRRRRIAELIERHPLQDPAQFGDPVDELAAAGRFLPVEVAHRHDGLHSMSGHDSPEQAAAYHDNQEYAEDWAIVALVDLDTGDAFEAEAHTVFKRVG